MTYAKGLIVSGLCSVLTVAVVFSGCGSSGSKNLRSRNSGNPDLTPKQVENDGDATAEKKPADETKKEEKVETETEVTPEVIPLSKIEASVGLRNYDQINATMSVITGIPTTTAAVKAVFVSLTTSMPTDSDIKGFLGSQQVSVFKLAVEYCDALVKDPAKRAEFFPGFNFAGTPAAALDASGKASLADTLVSKIWGKDLDFLPVHSQSVASVVALIDGVLVGKNTGQAAVTGAVVTGVCTAVLSSAPAIMY